MAKGSRAKKAKQQWLDVYGGANSLEEVIKIASQPHQERSKTAIKEIRSKCLKKNRRYKGTTF